MNLTHLIATSMLASSMIAAPAMAAPADAPVAMPSAAATTAGKYTTTDTQLGTMLDDPAAKAVLVEFLPDIVSNPQIDMGRGMTLKQMQGYAGDMLTDEKLAQIDIALAKLPAK